MIGAHSDYGWGRKSGGKNIAQRKKYKDSGRQNRKRGGLGIELPKPTGGRKLSKHLFRKWKGDVQRPLGMFW